MGVANREAVNEALKIIGLVGFSGTTVNAPSAAAGLARLLGRSHVRPADMNRLLYDLKRRGLVEVFKEAGQITFTLTPAGAYRLQALQLAQIRIPVAKVWDKKWRLVIFDIPEKKKRAREALREKLKELGFKELQKSVFVHPFESKDEVDFIVEFFAIRPYVRFLRSDFITNEADLKLRFKLS